MNCEFHEPFNLRQSILFYQNSSYVILDILRLDSRNNQNPSFIPLKKIFIHEFLIGCGYVWLQSVIDFLIESNKFQRGNGSRFLCRNHMIKLQMLEIHSVFFLCDYHKIIDISCITGHFTCNPVIDCRSKFYTFPLL